MTIFKIVLVVVVSKCVIMCERLRNYLVISSFSLCVFSFHFSVGTPGTALTLRSQLALTHGEVRVGSRSLSSDVFRSQGHRQHCNVMKTIRGMI